MATDALAPVTRRVRAFFAPRGTLFDPAQMTVFAVDAPAAPWVDLGWCAGFTRKCGTKIEPLLAGAPGVVQAQVRTHVEAQVAVEFEQWGKLQMALTCGAQQMNVLAAGGVAVPLGVRTTASVLDVGVAAGAGFAVGDLVAVDVDYAAQTGLVGAGASGGFVRLGTVLDTDYVRRVTLNVARVTGSVMGLLTLAAPLLGGVPSAGMKVSRVVGFCDREGGTFFQEWAGLFVLDGAQGDRVIFHYPRLQAATGATEKAAVLPGGLEKQRLAGTFAALPVRDPVDGESVVCLRCYAPVAVR